ncbi:MAG: dTDP-4-dehydrorhamnose reductase [Pseudomonadota bacterium]
MKKALLTGGTGQIGAAIAKAAERRGFTVYAPARDRLDLTKVDEIVAAVDADDWSIIINCAAYTAVDKAQSEPALANGINRVAPGIFASEAARRAIPIIHLSTDYVFDGGKASPYIEDDPVYPLGVYGASKESGEAAVRAYNPAHAIIRTAWVLSAGGGNFVDTMLRLACERDEIGVVNDQVGCPTSAPDIAEAVLSIAARMTRDGVSPSGTWHFVNSGSATWHDLAAFIFAKVEARGLKAPRLKAIATSEYPTPARRPANSQLDTTRIAKDFGITARHWHDAIGDILNERLGTVGTRKAKA